MSIFGDAWDWAKGAVGSLAGGVDDVFSAEQASAYNPNQEAFEYGGRYEDEFVPNQGGGWAAAGGRRRRVKRGDAWAEADFQRKQQALAQAQADRQRQQGALYQQGAGHWNNNANTALGASYASRGGQQSAYERLMSMADAGPGASAAQAQLRAGQDANMQQQLAMARSGRGSGGSASAQRQALFAGAQLGQQTNQQAAILRAQEEQAWRQQRGQLYGAAGGLATQQRGQDLGAFQGSGNLALGYGALQGQAEQRGLGYDQQQLGWEAMRQGVVQNATQAQMELERLKAQQHAAAQGLNVQSDMAQDSSMKGMAGTAFGAAALMSDRDAKTDIKPAQNLQLEVNPYEQMLEDQRREEVRDEQRKQMASQALMNWGMGQMRASDKREKSNVQRLMELDAQETVEKAPGYSYRYKEPERHGGGRFFGPMAQDLEKTPVGKSVVKPGPDGTKMVDTSRLSLVNTAALNGQQKQIDELMRKLDALTGKGRAA